MDAPKQLGELFSRFDGILVYLVPLGVFLAVLMVVVGGYMWIASAGDPDRVKQAQGTLTWAIIGLVFILIAVLLVNTLINAIGNL
jgi:hypothetical protein